MRLLKVLPSGDFELTPRLLDKAIPRYAILSHTWGPDNQEVVFEDMLNGSARNKLGYEKIKFCGEQAVRDGIHHFWVDSCCINKSSDAELSESLNSMFRWYRRAEKCYVYLSDISAKEWGTENVWEQSFRKSRWFTRGWTLQELLAPTTVEFFTSEGNWLGDRRSLERYIHEITGIPVPALRGVSLSGFGVDERLSWAETRQTTREEDHAYSMLGMFGVYIPLIYGEGRANALKRLQREIDYSLHGTDSRLPREVRSALPELRPYKYSPLNNPDHVRILRLRPSSYDHSDVDCEITEVAFEGVDFENSSPPIGYDAVSWCRGNEAEDQLLRIHNGDEVTALYTSRSLADALRVLRKHNTVRQLWIEDICIDPLNLDERNQHVAKKDKIYGKSMNLCVWLGQGDENTTRAIKFITLDLLKMWNFDSLMENHSLVPKWYSLLMLMKMPWFSRRLSVLEIALSPRSAILYCGNESIPWQDFADAVSSLVVVEPRTRRLVGTTDSPDFGGVWSMGATNLVSATTNGFLDSETGVRKPLLTLEYLVSRLSVFDATNPRDTIYAFLAISKDTTPIVFQGDAGTSKADKHILDLAKRRFVSEPYNVNYELPVIDVYQQFVEFAISKSHLQDPTKALDIICRPWAPIVKASHDQNELLAHGNKPKADPEIPLPSWISSLNGAAFEMVEHPTAGLRIDRQGADSLVGMPTPGQANYRATGTRGLEFKRLRFKKWESLKAKDALYPDYSMFVQGFILDEIKRVEQVASNGNIPYQWLITGDWNNTEEIPPDRFWRTLVADRGPDDRNPPAFYPRACRESMKFMPKVKSNARGTLDCKRMITEGRSELIAEFLRRVRLVIWNRALIKTREGRLGLARDDVRSGFKVCILYGCSVPVILQPFQKSKEQMEGERQVVYEEWCERRRSLVLLLQKKTRAKFGNRAKTKLETSKVLASDDNLGISTMDLMNRIFVYHQWFWASMDGIMINELERRRNIFSDF